ncbi:MAG: pyridoxamine 5'-phosphate oxidase family protein [Candidatus Lokiarchaeota archaeon]|nr:pyridoxamine 5'-phosphate oxidase family protein [Candidatus Lokiarchaeota archaeon]
MSKKQNFEFVEKQIRKRSFGIISTIGKNGHSHSTGIVYAVASSKAHFALYILTHRNYKKVKNIEINDSVSFVIPFPHHILRFVPASCVQFQGTAEILPFSDKDAQESFSSGSKILKMNLKEVNKRNDKEEGVVFIKIVPNRKLFCYGLGFSLNELRKNIETGSFIVTIPQER